jgi:hypothetical protein
MADKEQESIPYIHIDDATFLKRRWRYNHDVGAYLAPLEHESIEKMLMVWTRSKTISEQEQAVAVVTSAVREYFYYGKHVFEEKRNLLKHVLTEIGFEMWITDSTFPTFSQLKEEFWVNSERVGCRPSYSSKNDHTSAVTAERESSLASLSTQSVGRCVKFHQSVPQSLYLEKGLVEPNRRKGCTLLVKPQSVAL